MKNLSEGETTTSGAAAALVPAKSVPTRARAGRLRVLDGLRLFAALSVLAFHFTARDSYAWGMSPWEKFPQLSRVTQYGELGVNLFFVISGFVILMTAWGRSVESFSISRVTRLFPAYWVSVAATALLLIFVVPDSGVDVWEAIANLTMMQDAIDIRHVDGVYWTLWVELRFYLLMGLLLVWGLTRARVISLIVLWPLVAALVHTTDQALLSSLLIWNYAPYFGVGMALFLIYREGGSAFHWMLVAYNWAFIVGLTGRYHPSGPLTKTHYQPSLLVQITLITVCIGLVALCTTDAAQKIEWRWLTTAGALTYPLYLLHEHWGWYFISRLREFTPAYVTLALVTGACLLMAWVVHVAVERPLAPRIKRWLQSGLASVQSETAPADATSLPS
ncbi:Peptidoglycan/LPS O-acetylase OafA/YrhL, contains acyltransferase and SGNH-hydrolase domains [Pedococcus cremeus]|uniref:Peptidoglycan/LPS O-acetylase OafA/YrhL, contains acyltransferase and SGNH-hydrolase domains n=1 Tax=Pedococcus cremeus TaxID=587636 RepID=A0A1H9W3W6_9MICO|nr:acyltransferase [Pedococcus cremeus]SES28585.1 Peptidoglycan/LPS O-acetylase OafA/YrhL, contains acyltransferase and SGNH-hydrolase domains [Pedococcus cremeus]